MIRKTKTMTFDTETATLIKKVTESYYGDPAGYEMILFQNEKGNFFLYVNGGHTSPFPKEAITYYTKKRANEWLSKN